MKDIKQYITEGKTGWEFFDNVTDTFGSGIELSGLNKNNIKWLLVNLDSEIIAGVTEHDLDSWTEDDEYFKDAAKAIKSLNVGDSYDADGGINIYLRIRK